MANVEGQRVPAATAPTSGGGAGWTIQGSAPCHGEPTDHTRTWWRLHRPLFRQGHLPGQTGGNHLRPAARYRDGWQLRRLQPVGQTAQGCSRSGGPRHLFGRRTGDDRRRCLRTLAAGGLGDLWQGGGCDRSGGGSDVSRDGGRGSRGLAGGPAAHAHRHSALHASPGGRDRAAGVTHCTATNVAAGEPGFAPDSTARIHRTTKLSGAQRIPDGLPHSSRGLAPHSRHCATTGRTRFGRRRLA